MLSRDSLILLCIWLAIQTQFAMGLDQLPTKSKKRDTKNAVASKPRLIAIAGRYDKSIDNSIKHLLDKGNEANSAGNKDDAIASYREAITLLEQHRPDHKSELASALNTLGCLITNDGSGLEESKSLHERALALTADANFKNKITYTLNLASDKAQLSDLEGAEGLYLKALSLIETSSGLKSARAAIAFVWLSDIMMKEEKYRDAENYAQRAVDILSKESDFDNYRASGLSHLAQALFCQKKYVEAEGVYDQAIPLLKATYSDDDLRLANCYKMLGFIQKLEGKNNEASESWTKELTVRAKNLDSEEVFDYREGAPNCEHYYKDGTLYRKIRGNDFILEVATMWLSDIACIRADVFIENDSNQSVDILPTNVKAFYRVSNHKRQELQQVLVAKFHDITLKANTVLHSSNIAGTVCFQPDSSVPAGTAITFEIVIGKTTFSL